MTSAFTPSHLAGPSPYVLRVCCLLNLSLEYSAGLVGQQAPDILPSLQDPALELQMSGFSTEYWIVSSGLHVGLTNM